MLRFLVALLRARGIVPSLEDCPEGAPLVSARWLEAASTDDSSPAAAPSPRIIAWGAGVSSPAADEESPAPQVLIHGHEAAAGEESPALAASRDRADTRGAASGQPSRDSSMPRVRKTATRKRSMSARSG